MKTATHGDLKAAQVTQNFLKEHAEGQQTLKPATTNLTGSVNESTKSRAVFCIDTSYQVYRCCFEHFAAHLRVLSIAFQNNWYIYIRRLAYPTSLKSTAAYITIRHAMQSAQIHYAV